MIIQKRLIIPFLLTICSLPIFSEGTPADTVRKDDIHHLFHLNEVVVTAARNPVSTNAVSQKLNTVDIDHAVGGSLTSLLTRLGGVSSVSTGTVVSKPVIQGMYGNRILLVNDGAVLTGQQWGADHAPELDKNASSTIRVVKGAQSVRYGAEALGGIILLEPAVLPYFSDALHGKAIVLYGTNGRQLTATAHIESALPGLPQIAWRMQGTYSNVGDRSTARYLLNNTGSREANVNLAAGYKGRQLSAQLTYSLFNQQIGVMRSAQMGSEDLLRQRIKLGRPVDIEPFSRAIDYPRQHILHHTADLKLKYNHACIGTFDWQTTFQKDDRTENRIRRMNHSDIPAVNLNLSSWQHQLSWEKHYGRWQTEAGARLLLTDNHTQGKTGVVPVIPNYTENSLGLFAVQQYVAKHWGAEVGIRADQQQTKAAGYDWTGEYYGGSRRFGNLSYAIGANYRPTEQLKITSNFGLAWRAPHVYELYSNGNELGSGTYVIGDSTMLPERGYKWITSVAYTNRWLDLSVDGFLQWVDHYIYDEPTREKITLLSGAYPVFRYRQTPAFFRGGDIRLTLTPLSWLSWQFASSLVFANEQGSGRYLPFIPAARFDQQLTFKPVIKGISDLRITCSHKHVARQKRFDPATDLVDFTPPGYDLFGLEIGVILRGKARQRMELMLQADNIFNKEYKEYTNRSRYYAHDMGRDIRLALTCYF